MISSPIQSIPADQITDLIDLAVLFFDPSMPRKIRAFIKSAKNRETKILMNLENFQQTIVLLLKGLEKETRHKSLFVFKF
jgi:hypothetical protein